MQKPVHIDEKNPIAVFLGPSLNVSEARQILPANYFPPIKLGDLYALLATKIETVIIIDGLFDGTTPVWQREILAVLESGKQVYGASSMGALRAVELDAYGMRGYGQVFEWFRDGLIDGDDEVALLHGVEELNFIKVSEPLVNIRYNLRQAQLAGVLSSHHHDTLIAAAKSMYFGDRNFSVLTSLLKDIGGPSDSLTTYLDSHFIDIKERDAQELLYAVAQDQLELQVTAGEWYKRPKRYGTFMHSLELQLGAALSPTGHLIGHQQLLERLEKNWHHYRDIELQEIEYFYLTQSVVCSCSYDNEAQDNIVANWCQMNDIRNVESWLQASGMEHNDWLDRIVIEHEICAALKPHSTNNKLVIHALSKWIRNRSGRPYSENWNTQAIRRATIIVRIAQWAINLGYELPEEQFNDIVAKRNLLAPLGIPKDQLDDPAAERAFQHYAWLILDGPARFGYRFDVKMAVYKRLQMQARIRELA